MLKIKDSVNLKDLENFGFEITQNSFITHNDESCFEAILTKETIFGKYEYIIHERNLYLRSCFIDEYDDYDLDIICDLFEAGLVEKVEDNE